VAKATTRHRCLDCGATTVRWVGRCPSCGEWNSLVAESTLDPLVRAVDALDLAPPVPLASVDPLAATAVPTGVAEFDRVLSGGIVPGSVTLLLQVLRSRAAGGSRVLLVSAEESAHQVRLRAERLGPVPPSLLVLAATEVEAVAAALASAEPALVVVDSVQAVSAGSATDSGSPGGPPGTVAQVRAVADRLATLAKRQGVSVVLVGHVTKDGGLAGPRTLEHLVDTVLAFEGDRHHSLRLLRAVKHRFGPTGELGLFEMGDQGLAAVADPGRLLLGDRLTGVPGGIVLPAIEGRRTLVVELQALVTPMAQAQSKRSVVGLDASRLAMVLAVLARHTGLPTVAVDVFASVAGGVRVLEPAADLALALAVGSAVAGVPLPADAAAVGEVGLAGEVRQVTALDRRLEECARLGFRRIVVPRSAPAGPEGVTLVRVDTVGDALAALGITGTGPDGAVRPEPKPGAGPGPGTIAP
jgi:DNA repair protein RadA/Sms